MMTIAWNPLGFHLLDALPKAYTFNAEYYPVNILTELSRSAHRLMGGESLFILTTQDSAPPDNAELFAKKIGSPSPYTYRTQLISHHPTSFSSEISDTVYRKSLSHHVKNYLQQFMKSSGHSATNLGGRASALDGETRMGFSERW
jgi:hypothetical protein